ISTNSHGAVVTNIFYIAVNELTYGDGGRWGKWSDGGGSSLELTDPDSDNRYAANWADSDESSKSVWTAIDVTDVMENGQTGIVNEGDTGQATANRFELFLQGEGEAILDDMVFLSNGGANLVANGDFASGTNNWVLGGVLRRSYAENNAGSGGSAALHLVSAGRGDTGPNKISQLLSSTAATGAPNTGTMRAQVRWLKGDPYVLLRMRGNWMEVSQRLNVPTNLGTPGLPNSRLIANAGPAITDVAHAPVLPAAGQSVVVTARAADPDGVGSLTLNFRVDPATTYTSVAMLDNGTGGDAVANDGIYSATIPGQADSTLAAFYVTATDGLGASKLFPAEAPTRECHVRWGESVIAGSIGTYRIWVTAANIAFWTARERNANDTIDATFVYGNFRAVYNVDTMYSGSPFHTPAYNGPLASIASDYEVNFHPDELFLGSKAFVLTAFDVADGNFFFNDDSGQVDLTGNWIARKLGQQYNYRRHINVFMNGQRRGTIYDDAQQPNGEMLDEYFSGTDTELRKIESWFEFAADGQAMGSVYATLKQVNKST
ncbi:MAG TPA: choice-of-anchor X domain-containing protein, partial [Candidatus Paceibacterota bacterium]|nr:choice-of-anchor X domain-containing protein [Candidatus Paceibacterota bacterium]